MSENSEFFISEKIKLQPSPVHGNGIFAVENINTNEMIEISPLIKLDWKLKYHYDRVIRDYCWMNRQCPCEDCKINGPSLYLALGYGSMYNHHDNPNTNVKLDYTKAIIFIKATNDIQKGDEIFVSYGTKYFSSDRRKAHQSETTKEETDEEKSKHTRS